MAVVDRTPGGAEETIASLPSDTDEQIHKSFVADVGDGDAVRGLVAGVMDTYKKPATILVNSAGITRDQLMLKMTEEDFDEVIKVNLKVIGQSSPKRDEILKQWYTVGHML